MNERKTENLCRQFLRDAGMLDNVEFLVEEQRSDNPIIQRLLKNSSKSGFGIGKPEFIIRKRDNNDFLIVIECKADVKFHESKNRDNYKNYAVDGVLLYASSLSREFNVIAIAISGESYDDFQISTFLYPKKASSFSNLFDENNQKIQKVLSWDRYIDCANFDPVLAKTQHSDLMKFSRELHHYMRDYAKITEAQKPLLVSGILLALMDKGFEVAYLKYDGADLASETFSSIKKVIEKVELGDNHELKKKAVINAFSFIEHHPELQKINSKLNESPLMHIIRDLYIHVQPFTKNHYDFDIIGNFYGEFIRYTGGDGKGLGIVLTPKHITDLFADLAKLNKNSVVLDICAGTGGFLISAMKKMTRNVSSEEKRYILSNSLIGIEQEPQMFALSVSNMILRGDGKTNLYQGSCFDDELFNKVRGKATVGFMNPPYSQKGENLHEWNFVIRLLNGLSKNAIGVVIVPMSLAVDVNHPLRNKLLSEHRIEAVMSMPDDLFYPVGVVSCIMVFTAHVPHNSDEQHETWFGYWKDDGFRKDKALGRIPKNNSEWERTKDKWLNMFRKKEIIGKSVWRKVTKDDEWCVEAYMETNYELLSDDSFVRNIKKYLSYKLTCPGSGISITPSKKEDIKMYLDVKTWAYFDFDITDNSVFTIKKGKRLTKFDQSLGDIPYISSSALNNGVDNYISNGYSDENCISFACYGSIGEVFYHPGKVWISDNANAFYLKDRDLNPYLAMFFVTLLELEKFRFSYGMTGKKERLKNFRIKLPIMVDGGIDFDWIERYIKSLPYSQSL
jgi:type I restriction-modification system DNA methylase subunit